MYVGIRYFLKNSYMIFSLSAIFHMILILIHLHLRHFVYDLNQHEK